MDKRQSLCVAGPLFRGTSGEHADAIKQSAQDSHVEFLHMEDMLTESGYLTGAIVSAADIVYSPVVLSFLRAVKREDATPLDLGFQNFDDLYPKIAAWFKRMEALPGYDKASPPHWRD